MKRVTMLLLLAEACFAPPELASPAAVTLHPPGLIEPGGTVEVRFSAAVLPPVEPGLVVRDRDGAAIAVAVEISPTVWRLRPEGEWPGGEVLTVQPDGPVLDEGGTALVWPEDGLLFEVAPRSIMPKVAIRWPTPGTLAPAGVRWIGAEGVLDDVSTISLSAEDHALLGRRRATFDGVTRFDLEDGPCSGLCPDTVYALQLEQPVVEGIRSQVRTATSSDTRPPTFTLAEVEVRPGRLEWRWACDEPVFIQARISTASEPVEVAAGLGRSGVWIRDLAVEPGSTLLLRIEAIDLSLRPTVGVDRRVVAPDRVAVALREFVATPRSDWGDSEPRGEPFDESPGQGTVSSADEWLELVNASESAIDIAASGLRILTLDRTPTETIVARAPALRFGDGGDATAWRPAEALVVRPRGDMTQSDLVIEVWAGALLLDRVVVSEEADADHPGGAPPDLHREALARQPNGRWRWCRPTPGDPRPNEACDE